jgi:hypothetical protein
VIAGIYTDIYSDPALAVLEKAALSVAYSYKDWISEADLYQSAWEWRLRHPVLVSSFMDREEGADVKGLERVIRSYLESVGRKEKALACGYHPDDEMFYRPAVIAELLPMVFDIEASLLPAAPSDDAPGRGSNPHGQGDFVASLLDVRQAWLTTPFRGDESRMIEARYVDDMEWDHLAASFGVEVEDAKRTVAIGLRRMANQLGGLPARACSVDCECKEVPQ